MNPSIGLAAALTAASLCPPAFAALPPGLCVPTEAVAPAPDLFDASKEALDDGARAKADAAGVKLDAKTCHLLAADGHPLTRAEVAAFSEKKPGAGKTPPSDPDAAKKNGAAKQAVAGLGAAGGAAGSYGDSTHRFDGAVSRDESAAVAGVAAVGGGADGVKLSAVLSAGLQDTFKKEAAGRDLLAHFTDADGAVHLPTIVVADYGGSVAAVYDRPTKTVRIDSENAAKLAVAAAPEAERPALARKLADPAKLSAYLLDHPEARAALLDDADTTAYHEIFHAWQERRDPKVDAVEGKDPVEWEREAYREELRYFHQKLMSDPSLADRGSDMDMYRKLLRGYPEYKQYVTELYQNSFGSADFPTVEALLAKRAKAGSKGAAGQLSGLRETETAYDQRESDYAEKTLPAMQAEAYPKMIDRQMKAGHPAEALSLAFDAPDGIRGEKGPAAFAATRQFIESDPPAPVADRLKAWDAYLAYQTKTTNTNVLDDQIFKIYQRDRRAAVESKLAEAARSRGDDRSNALAWAKSYASELPEKAELLKRIAAVAKPAAR